MKTIRIYSWGLLLLCMPVSGLAAPENLIPNASFEVGACPASWAITGGDERLLTAQHLDPSTAVHGKVSLKLRLLNRTLFSAPMKVPEAGDYLFSAYVKAGVPTQIRLGVESEKGTGYGQAVYNISTNWQQIELKVALPADLCNVRITPTTNDPTQYFWVDAVSLGAGTEPVPFVPHRPIEAGLSCDVPAKVFYANEEGLIILRVANYGTDSQPAKFRYFITDMYDQKSQDKELDLGLVPGGSTKEIPMNIDTTRRGLFSLQGKLDSRDAELTEIVYAVFPKPTQPTLLAAHMTLSRTSVEALSRAGVHWYESLTDHIHRLGYMRPTPDQFVWFDEEVNLLSEYGMEGIGCLEYFSVRGDFSWAHGQMKKLDMPIVTRGGVHTEIDYIKDDLWRDHVRQIIFHYRKPIKNWVIDDEVTGGFTPAMYLDILRSAKEVANSIDPVIKIATSADAPWFEELIDLGGLDTFDAMGGSVGNAPYWNALKMGWLGAKYNKAVWVTGIFEYGGSFYHLHVPKSDWLHRATSIYRAMMRCFFLQHAANVAPYIFRYSIFSATRVMSHTFFDFDGSFKPQGIGFLMAGNVFAGMEPDPAPIVYPFLKQDSYLVHAFRKRGQRGILLSGSGQRLKIPLARKGIEILDWFENPVDIATIEGNEHDLYITLPSRPLYLYDKGVGPEQLIEAVKAAQRMPPADGLQTGSLFLVQDKKLSRVNVTANMDTQPHEELKPGQAKVTESNPQANLLLTRPLENEKGCWLANCLKLDQPVTLDGKMEEWKDRSACWMYVDWGFNSPPDRRELHIWSGGQFINYQPWYDFKVGFYTGYDRDNLYLAFLVNDDDIAPAEMAAQGVYDGVRIYLDTHVLEDLGTSFGSDDDYLIEARLTAKNQATAELAHNGVRTPLSAAAGNHPRGYTIELTVPLKTLHIAGDPVLTGLGLNVIATDADYDRKYSGPDVFKREKSELCWAADNPFLLGALLFVEKK